MRAQTVTAAVLGCLALAGCEAPRAPTVCAAGATQRCVCAGGAEGAQVCNASGSAWGSCDCAGAGTDAGRVFPLRDAGGVGSDGSRPGPTLDDWYDAMLAKAGECCRGDFLADGYFNSIREGLDASMRAGASQLHPDVLARCLEDTTAASCLDWSYQLGELPGACLEWHTSLLPAGAPCFYGGDCEPDMICTGALGSQTCMPLPQVGEACPLGTACALGLHCNQTTYVCETMPSPGDPCVDEFDCALSGAVCTAGMCAPYYCAP